MEHSESMVLEVSEPLQCNEDEMMVVQNNMQDTMGSNENDHTDNTSETTQTTDDEQFQPMLRMDPSVSPAIPHPLPLMSQMEPFTLFRPTRPTPPAYTFAVYQPSQSFTAVNPLQLLQYSAGNRIGFGEKNIIK